MDGKKLCPLVQDLLPGLIDGVVSPEAEEILRRHLAECADCREMYEKLVKPDVAPQVAENIPVEKFVKKHKIKQWIVGVFSGIMLCVLALVSIAGYYVVGEEMPKEIAVSHSWNGGYLVTADGGKKVTEIRIEGTRESYRNHRKGENSLMIHALVAIGEDGEELLRIEQSAFEDASPMKMTDDGTVDYGLLIYFDKAKTKTYQEAHKNGAETHPMDYWFYYGSVYMDTDWEHMILWKRELDSWDKPTDGYYLLVAGNDIHTATDAKNLITTTSLDIADETREALKDEIEKFH